MKKHIYLLLVLCAFCVSLNAQKMADKRTSRDLELNAAEQELKAGQSYDIPITALNLANVQGFQFSIFIDPTVAEITGIESGILHEDNFGFFPKNGLITSSWNVSTPLTKEKLNEVLFTLKINSRKDIPLSKILGLQNRPTTMEAYTHNDEQVGIKFNFQSAVAQGDKAVLFQNSPNPFSEETVIAFFLPQAGKATLVVRNVEGKLLYRTQADFSKGQQQFVLKQSDVKASGVLNYTLETANFTETKKMVVVTK
jgi:hypothetical protein